MALIFLIKLGFICLNPMPNLDSAIIYYLPISSTFTHHISKENIDIQTDAFKIYNTPVLKKMDSLISDGLTAIPAKKNRQGNNIDIRILIKCYSKGVITKEIVISENNDIAFINGKAFIILNIDAIQNFIQCNLVPLTEKQKAYFKTFKKRDCT